MYPIQVRILILIVCFLLSSLPIAKAQDGEVPPPVFSHAQGFYPTPFQLGMHAREGDTIFFTTDGSVPDAQSYRYQAPVLLRDRTPTANTISEISTTAPFVAWSWKPPADTVRKAHVIRAVAISPKGEKSSVSNATFFVGQDLINHYTFPVISIITDQANFFDDEIGIMVPGNTYAGHPFSGNYFQRGREWERPAHLTFFDENGLAQVSQNIGVRIHGGATRRYPQKSLRIYARSDYDEKSDIAFELFPGNRRQVDNQILRSYKRLILRSSGDDWHYTMFKDALLQSLIQDLRLDTQAHRPSVVFINGEYWGIHNIRERYDGWYLQTNYDIHRDDVGILVNLGELNTGLSSDRQHYTNMRNYARSMDMREAEHFAYVEERMDMDNYIDYYALQMFFANADWPHNNIRFWRKRTTEYQPEAPFGHDGRWRWMVFDLDGSFGFPYPDGWAAYDFDMFSWVTGIGNDRNGSVLVNVLFNNLIQNEGFRHNLVNTIMDHLNTRFRTDVMQDAIDFFERTYRPEMEEHIRRHPDSGGRSMMQWNTEILVLRNFAIERPDYMLAHLQNYFNLSDPVTLTFPLPDISGGYMLLNRTPLTQSTPGVSRDTLRTRYFEEIPIRVTAKADPGFEFVRWHISGAENLEIPIYEPEITIAPTEGLIISPEFRFDSEHSFYPQPFPLTDGPYHFSEWQASAPAGTYPDNMVFVYFDEIEPGLEANIAGAVQGAYNLSSRTRINGLGDDGFSFINTSNLDGNEGFPGNRLGGAILALDTRDTQHVMLDWTAGTLFPNSRIYHISLEYRTDVTQPFQPIRHSDGSPVIYARNAEMGHQKTFAGILLPEDAHNQSHVQLLWRYFYTGEQESLDSGQRSMLHISDIKVFEQTEADAEKESEIPGNHVLYANYPNPFNANTIIPFSLAEPAVVSLRIYDMLGRQVTRLLEKDMPAGVHRIPFYANNLASGVYIVILNVDEQQFQRTIVLIK